MEEKRDISLAAHKKARCRRFLEPVFCLSVFVLASCGNLNDAREKDATAAGLFEMSGSAEYASPRHVEAASDALSNQAENLSSDWYIDSSFYHIWVKSFYDSDGDGCGDIAGITAKLDYIQHEVGCDALWLSPIFDCAGKGKAPGYNMHGYDTVDYYSINPLFGDELDVEALLEAAHARGMKVIFDFVPNHTSSSHPWFMDSETGTEEKKSWYLWNASALSWNPMGSANTWHKNLFSGEFFYAPFWAGMPDLNYRNREVREEMKNVARYWLNKGFDGMRIDAVRYLVEDADDFADTEATHAWFRELRSEVVDLYGVTSGGSPKFMVGEAWISGDRATLNSYFGTQSSPEFHMLFDFEFAGKLGKTPDFAPQIPGTPVSYAGFLSNHDNFADRPASRWTDAELRLKTAQSLLLPVVPFVYYGNEAALENDAAYGNGDIRLRQPFDWSSAEGQSSDPDSVLSLHRALLRLRSRFESIRRGAYTRLAAPEGSTNPYGVSAYALSLGLDGAGEQQTLVCVFNSQYRQRNSGVSFDLSSVPGLQFSDSETSSSFAPATLAGRPSSASVDFIASAGTEQLGTVSGTEQPAQIPVLSVTGLGPCAFRVYLVSGTIPQEFAGALPLYSYEHAIPETDDPDPAVTDPALGTLYLRGSMNGWGADAMAGKIENGDEVWSVTMFLKGLTRYEFKFETSGGTVWQENWGEGGVADGPNIQWTSGSEGLYDISVRFGADGSFSWTASPQGS